MTQKAWEDAVVRAAAEASRLQPLALGIVVIASLLVVGQYVAVPISESGLWTGEGEPIAEVVTRGLTEAGPAIALVWALWETQAYLGRLARGDVWAPATMTLLGRVGDSMIVAAALGIVVGPTVHAWVTGYAGFDWQLEPLHLALAGLGLVLSLIARVVRNVVEVAASLKAENDQIV